LPNDADRGTAGLTIQAAEPGIARPAGLPPRLQTPDSKFGYALSAKFGIVFLEGCESVCRKY
jgi:hypothetical protein